ncbi:MAG: Fe-S cluster assembly protein SufD [Candidatus Pelagadaptatus aseana]|uniref:Fe-S cluster assembly protein SufD n=1 Tax=Candidatus Pelagadaptatus aseana TaxID=3120508 RepID=UPI0039B32F00
MSAWLEGALERAEKIEDWLAPQRSESLSQLKNIPWPTRKTEAWKYFSLRPVEDSSFSQAAANQDVTVEQIADLDSLDLVFVDGRLEMGSDALPEGLRIVSLVDASVDEQAIAQQIFTKVKPARHVFGLVNDVLASDGVLIDVAEGAVIDTPIRIVNIHSEGVESHTRVLVRLANNAKLSVIEQCDSQAEGLSTVFSEYLLGDEAELEHYRFALQSGAAINIGGCHFSLANKTQLNSTLIGFGSKLARLDVDVAHNGQHAFAKMNAVYLLDTGELFDLHSCIEHAQPHGTTEENVRGIVGDRSRAVFNGRIHIHRDAQKTLAELNNRNLLLSDRAEINTKPELEIYADDVRCAHGATVAEIDKKALYYLQSRGIDKAHAQVMLNFGFINELVDDMPNEALAEWLRPQLRARFASMEVQ